MESKFDVGHLIGTWVLESWEFEREDGTKYYPMGQDCLGRLVYTPDGYMSGMLMKKDRRKFPTQGIFDGSVDQRAAAFNEMIAYSGRYEVGETKITHLVDVSLFPNWIGTKQERFFEWSPGRLILSTAPVSVKDGKKEIGRLIWRRP